MHLIIVIALGVFGGLWLFVRCAEWREARIERREARRLQRAERRAEQERMRAELAARPPAPPLIKSGPWVGFAVVGCWVLVLVVLAFGT